MELFETKKGEFGCRNGIILLRVTHSEALMLITSLAEQIRTGNMNGPRYEQFLDDGRDFSIAVHKDR